MGSPGRIQKLDEVVVNRIAAGEVIQRPANALKELIENSLDAKSTNIQITVKDGGLKSLQIQDNGTGIRRDDLEIVCERFTTSKLRKFDDLKSITTFGFRGEALASMSHVAHLTITTKTVDDKVAYKASYTDGKLKSAPKPIAGNQGTTILIENLFHNVVTRRKALTNHSEEFTRIGDVVTKYSIHNPHVGFLLKKQGEVIPTVRTPPNSTKSNNVKQLFGNAVARELLDIELIDDSLQFKMHSLITNPNYSGKRLSLTIFINNRLIDSSPIKKMLEDLYSVYLPKKTYPWCYISLEINPQNVDVNVHPTKYEVRFLHEESIIEKVKVALDEKLSSTNATRTFYVQARLPQVQVTKDVLEKVLPEYDREKEKSKMIYQKEMIRTDATDQKLDRFNFRVQKVEKPEDCAMEVTGADDIDDLLAMEQEIFEKEVTSCSLKTPRREAVVSVHSRGDKEKIVEVDESLKEVETPKNIGRAEVDAHWSSIVDEPTPEAFKASSTVLEGKSSEKGGDDDDALFPKDVLELFSSADESSNDAPEQAQQVEVNSSVASRALKNIYQYFGSQKTKDEEEVEGEKRLDRSDGIEGEEKTLDRSGGMGDENKTLTPEKNPEKNGKLGNEVAAAMIETMDEIGETSAKPPDFKSYSINNFRREVKLTSVLKLRKNVEDNYHEGLRKILAELTFVGCVDEDLALIQSDVNLYICNTTKLAEELFYEIMLYDFANYGVIRFSEPLPLYDLAMIGLETEEAEWSEEDGPKEEIAGNVRDLLVEKSDMLKEYFAIVIDKRGNLKSLPVLLEKYFPSQAEIPLYILRLSTEVEWSVEQPCFNSICRETAKFYSKIDANNLSSDWQHITEHVLYPAIKESLLPPKHFAHDSTILQIASLPNLYKVFERC